MSEYEFLTVHGGAASFGTKAPVLLVKAGQTILGTIQKNPFTGTWRAAFLSPEGKYRHGMGDLSRISPSIGGLRLRKDAVLVLRGAAFARLALKWDDDERYGEQAGYVYGE